ncbi:MAG: nuclear transport factor 2 family protein [Bacteroidetes bacterium]|nr:nuclear transport factor 2 family protein [Bacteroidota bacterium]
MKTILGIGIFLFSCLGFAQYAVKKSDSLAIVNILFQQQADWNAGDIDAFMEGYLKSDQLVFSGASGPIFGWEATRDRYKRTYSDRERMGVLKFDVLHLLALSETVVQLQGKFYLQRTSGDLQGFFTLNWILLNKQWYIISDHTSGVN